MDEPQTLSGRRLLNVMPPSPLGFRDRREDAVMVLAIEAEAVAAERARLRSEVEAMEWVENDLAVWVGNIEYVSRVAVLALLADPR